MNLQRFVLPATIAAAFHAVLLMQGKVPVTVTPPKTTVEAPERPLPPEDRLIEIPLPTETDTDPAPQVNKLAQGTELPQIEEIFSDKPTSEFRVDVENISPAKRKVITTMIGPIGVPEGELNGDLRNGPSFQPAVSLDKIPRATVRSSPVYPSALRNDGIEGDVMVEFDVDSKGRVVSARVRGSTHRAFEEPTMRAVLQWRFEPGLKDGRPVPFRMVIPVNFKLGAG